jgi:hypothetical protein
MSEKKSAALHSLAPHLFFGSMQSSYGNLSNGKKIPGNQLRSYKLMQKMKRSQKIMKVTNP